MLKNYLKVAFRSIIRNQSASIVNIGGLAIGFASFILIMVYVFQEMSFDGFHSKSDSIYRVTTIDEALGVSSNNVAITMPIMVSAIKDNFPEVIAGTRMMNAGRLRIEQGDDYIYSEDAKYVEKDFFELFDYTLLDASTVEAFNEPHKMIMTESMAENTFGDEEAVGQIVSIDEEDWEVVGLLKDETHNTHLNLDVLLSLYPSAADSNLARYLDSWRGLGMIGYVQLQDPSQEQVVEEKMYELAVENESPEFWRPQLQPLSEVHLGSADILFDGYNSNKGDLNYVYSLSAVALFVILIAAFNFMNLSTAKSSVRAREVGVRKVLGAKKLTLMGQHLGESMLISLISLAIAILLVIVIGPLVDMGLTRPLTSYLMEPIMWVGMISVTLVIGVFAGLYPAFVLSNFKSIQILKGKLSNGKGITLRKLLVITQFTTSIVMIVGTILVFQQLEYIKNKSLGFDKEQLVTFQLSDQRMGQQLESFKEKLMEYESITAASTSSNMPGRTFGRTGVTPEGVPEEDENWIVSAISFDDNYLKTMDMNLLEGRNFTRESADQQESVIVNEALIKQVGWESGLGKTLRMGNDSERTIIGVLEDFHFASMRHTIEPLIMFFNPGPAGNISFRIEGDVSDAMTYAESVWSEIYPQYPFDYQFFDEEFNQIYQGEENFSRLVISFTWLAIFIACLGLFGLSAFMAEQRRKEIGVRKVLGSSIAQIVGLLSKEFVILILIANVIAWPLAYLGISNWLESFQYRIDLLEMESLMVFALSGIAALLIGLITVSYQSISAAVTNPVNALRDE